MDETRIGGYDKLSALDTCELSPARPPPLPFLYLSLPCHCLSLTFYCLVTAFPWPCHCLATVFSRPFTAPRHSPPPPASRPSALLRHSNRPCRARVLVLSRSYALSLACALSSLSLSRSLSYHALSLSLSHHAFGGRSGRTRSDAAQSGCGRWGGRRQCGRQ